MEVVPVAEERRGVFIEKKKVIKVFYRSLSHLMASSLVSECSWVWTNVVQCSLEKCHEDCNVAGRMFHASALTSLTVQQSIASIMLLIKFSQFLHFCAVKGGYNFLLQVFQVLEEIDHATVIQVYCSSCYVVVLYDCLVSDNGLSNTTLSFSAAWH